MTEFYTNSLVPVQDNINSLPDEQFFFDQTANKFEHVSKVNQQALSTKTPLQLTEEYLFNSSFNVLLQGNNKFAVDQVVSDYGLLSACEKNLIKNLAKKEDIHGVYYLLGLIYLSFSRIVLLDIIKWVAIYNGQKEFKEEVIAAKVPHMVNLKNFSDKEIALFYRFFKSISIETFESIGSRFNPLLKQQPPQQLPQQQQQQPPQQQQIVNDIESNFCFDPYIDYSSNANQQEQYSSPIPSPTPSSASIDLNNQVFGNYSTVEVVNDCLNIYSPNTDFNYSSPINSINSTPTISSVSIINAPSSPLFDTQQPSSDAHQPSYEAQQVSPSSSYSQIAPSTPSGPLFFQNDCSPNSPQLPFFESFPNVKLESITNDSNNINNTSSFSSQFSSHVQPKSSNLNSNNNLVGKSKRVTKTKSIPKAIVTPLYRGKLVDFGFNSQELDRASHIGSLNYVASLKGHSSIANTMLHPIPTEVSTSRIVRNGLIVFIRDIDQFQRVSVQASLYSRGDKPQPNEHFELKKSAWNQIEPGVYHFEFSIKRIEKIEKYVSIQLDLYSNNVHFDTLITPFIRFRNTPSEFSHPSENIILKCQPYVPLNLPLDICLNNYVPRTFISITNFFKKGIKSTERHSEADGETIQKPGKPLIIQFKNNTTNEVTRVFQHISKVQIQDQWKFSQDSKGNIINFSFSNIIEFSCIIQKGIYDITFLYDNVARDITPQITNYIIN